MRAGARAAIACAAAAALLRPAGAGEPEAPPARAWIRVEPSTIDIGMFHRGTTVRVEGAAPAGSRVALVCVGGQGKVELKRKGKVWNVLWMNVGTVAFERVPTVVHVAADVDGADRRGVPPELRLGLGYDGVEAQVLPVGADDATRLLFQEFVRLKVAERLYSFEKLRPASATGSPPSSHVSAEFSLPPGIPPGEYEVRMIGFRDGTAELLATEKITARRVGLALLVATMAQRSGILYGILSVVLATGAGFLTGVVFSASRKPH
ncbi:MAG TPA: TIGR02186 family protein [Anaeromyxobacteraceae bacterium]|nr:TIGR02186 family protein [Anaeromyxobacteraceae bacterium]